MARALWMVLPGRGTAVIIIHILLIYQVEVSDM